MKIAQLRNSGGGLINLTLVPYDLLTDSEKSKNRERWVLWIIEGAKKKEVSNMLNWKVQEEKELFTYHIHRDKTANTFLNIFFKYFIDVFGSIG